MGQLDKQTFSQFSEFDCERQLFINLGRKDPDWFLPANREIKKLEDARRHTKFILEIGKKYEKEIYQSINKRSFAVFSSNPSGSVVKTTLTSQGLLNIADNVTSNTPKVLLEHEFPTPQKFLRMILGIINEKTKIPIKDPSHKLRPDLMFLKKHEYNSKNKIRTLNENQEIIELSMKDIKEKVGISMVDIKVSPSDAIGKKQFVELAFYTLAFNQYLFDNKLNHKMYVRLDSNGILPKVENTYVVEIEELEAMIEILRWDETFRLFDLTAKAIQKLKNQAPCLVEKTSVNIQPACGRCNYLNDCITTLGVTENGDRKEWDVRLLPYTSRSMVEQLNQRGFNTIGDVAERISDIQIGSTPEAIYPQLPLLQIKSQAIVSDKEIKPDRGTIHSVAIPIWNEMSLTVNVEEDPIYKRIMALSYYLSISVPKTSKYADNFNKLISIWSRMLREKMPLARAKLEIKQISPTITDLTVNPCLKALENLWKLNDDEPNSLKIVLKGEKLSEKNIAENNFLTLGYANVNSGLDDSDEFNFAKKSVRILHDILIICDFIEQFVIFFEEIDGKQRYYTPRLAIYYWSREILEAIQTMLERHLNSFTDDDESRNAFYYIIRWFTPTDSGIADPHQHKKVYDLRVFVETTIGLPAIINYTWHAIAEQRFNRFFKKKYWRNHFNYVDFQVWHELLSISDISDKYKLVKELKSQMLYKVQTIDRIRFDFQKSGRELISRYAKPTDYFISRRNRLPNTYNYVAHMWFLFSKLTSAMDEHDALFIRTMYPEFSIGKLAAGEVSDIQEHDGTTEKRRFYTFKLKNLSSNMKISEGSRVLLLPSELRDGSIHQYSWSVNIDQMTWNSLDDCYEIVTQESTVRVYENFREVTEKEISSQWYLYPTSFDAWSRKLFQMLNLYNLGHSWLGKKIAFDWNLLPLKSLEYPESNLYLLPEIYLFAPTLLNNYKTEVQGNLNTQVYPYPDPSQKEAILNSLSRPISIIHGPPGTGKSQTIIALIDEFLTRTDRLNPPRRILITAFSYPAMKVLVNKLRESVDENGQPTPVRKIAKLFIRSGYQKIVSNEGLGEDDIDFVNDFMCNKGGTWKLNEDLYPKQRGTISDDKKLEDHFTEDLIIFSNAHQLTKLRFNGKKPSAVNSDEFAFDLIIIDEASQLPVDQILPSITMVHRPQVSVKFPSEVEKEEPIVSKEVSESLHIPDHVYLNLDNLTKLVLVGDNYQLPPVQPIKPPINLEIVLGSVFQYYGTGHQISSKQLKTNYRSHRDIVSYTGNLGFYESLKAFQNNADRIIVGNVPDNIPNYVKAVLDPNLVVSSIIHNKNFEISVSPLECDMSVEIIVAFFKMINPITVENQLNFWKNEIGVVAPHNAQGRLIIRNLYERLLNENLSLLSEKEFMNAIKSTVYSVEKFQGSDRTMIIASIGISSTDQISAEEDFIFDINRFNVLTSRAKSKVILIASRNYLDYFPNKRVNVENASQIRYYALEHCNKSQNFKFIFGGIEEEIEMRWYYEQR
ncbi:MAG: ATP-dependent RecD-like DNA helicase [Candidatus Heimdallarchaeota archaeon LC_2]|nr:MAG: ATP-dependent RecD-like DNA helicase [Candidatus Heimdallarchaeota archaeon LC_2]